MLSLARFKSTLKTDYNAPSICPASGQSAFVTWIRGRLISVSYIYIMYHTAEIDFKVFKNSIDQLTRDQRAKPITAPMSFHNIIVQHRRFCPDVKRCNFASVCTTIFILKHAYLWKGMFTMNLNWNICSDCSILFRQWVEFKNQLFYKSCRFRNYHAIINALDAPLHIVRFYSNFFLNFYHHIWNLDYSRLRRMTYYV